MLQTLSLEEHLHTIFIPSLTYQQLGDDFDLISALAWGTLPFVVNAISDEEKGAFLRSYTATYLQ